MERLRRVERENVGIEKGYPHNCMIHSIINICWLDRYKWNVSALPPLGRMVRARRVGVTETLFKPQEEHESWC